MFDFDFGLGDEIDMLRESVRDFANDHIAPRAEEIDATNHRSAAKPVRETGHQLAIRAVFAADR